MIAIGSLAHQGRVATEAAPSTAPRPAATASSQHRRAAAPPNGTVKFFDAKKGYGFIVDDRGNDIFVHASAVQASGLRLLEPGQQVAFDLETGRKGQEAHRLRLVG